MSLEGYKKKRKFGKTPEPVGKVRSTGKRIFVVQEHQAKNLHWDLRLEKDGVLKSWAVPKGVPIEPKVKRLCIPTEDHPVEYADFEGEIPEGNYGAGTVKVWDRGTFQEKVWRSDKIETIFNGKKLKGTYVMIKTKMGWLIFKMSK
jgi:DNA ligase D-like protein (predicted 3'-phosphoesterase)